MQRQIRRTSIDGEQWRLGFLHRGKAVEQVEIFTLISCNDIGKVCGNSISVQPAHSVGLKSAGRAGQAKIGRAKTD